MSIRRSLLVASCFAICLVLMPTLAVGASPASTRTASAHVKVEASTTACVIAGQTVKTDSALNAQLPSSIRSGGTLTVATDPSSPPYEFINSSDQLDGLEVQLAAAIGCNLGLQVWFSTLTFEGILIAVRAGHFNMGMSSISDTVPREKVMNFVDYQTEGPGIVVVKGNPYHIKTIADLCGLKVAGTAGSIPLQLLEKQASLCKKKMSVTPLPNTSDGYLAVRSGRVNAFMDTYGTAMYISEHQSGSGLQLETIPGVRYAVGYQSIALGKSAAETQLTKVVQKSVTALKKTGFYGALFQKWGVTVDEVKTITINDAIKYNGSFLNL
jgi:polar amino acid transport system substrate-binding protein